MKKQFFSRKNVGRTRNSAEFYSDFEVDSENFMSPDSESSIFNYFSPSQKIFKKQKFSKIFDFDGREEKKLENLDEKIEGKSGVERRLRNQKFGKNFEGREGSVLKYSEKRDFLDCERERDLILGEKMISRESKIGSKEKFAGKLENVGVVKKKYKNLNSSKKSYVTPKRNKNPKNKAKNMRRKKNIQQKVRSFQTKIKTILAELAPLTSLKIKYFDLKEYFTEFTTNFLHKMSPKAEIDCKGNLPKQIFIRLMLEMAKLFTYKQLKGLKSLPHYKKSAEKIILFPGDFKRGGDEIRKKFFRLFKNFLLREKIFEERVALFLENLREEDLAKWEKYKEMGDKMEEVVLFDSFLAESELSGRVWSYFNIGQNKKKGKKFGLTNLKREFFLALMKISEFREKWVEFLEILRDREGSEIDFQLRTKSNWSDFVFKVFGENDYDLVEILRFLGGFQNFPRIAVFPDYFLSLRAKGLIADLGKEDFGIPVAKQEKGKIEKRGTIFRGE